MLFWLLALPTLALCQISDDKVVERRGSRHGCSKASGWPSWGRDLDNTRSNPDSNVSVCNVNTLKLSWLKTLKGDILGGPALEDGYLYVVDTSGDVTKLEEANGSIVWQRNINSLLNIQNGYSRTTPIVLKDSIIIGVHGPAKIIALSKYCGSLIWSTLLDAHPAALITQSGTAHEGIVYFGVSSNEESLAIDPTYPCCSFVGSMAGLSVKTGEILWQTKMIPDNLAGLGKLAGCSIWGSAPPVDDKYVYISTGNLYSLTEEIAVCQTACDADPQSCVGNPPCVPENVHFDSVLALNRFTGKIRWATRLQATDAWTVACPFGVAANCPLPTGPDYDFGQSPILVNKKSLIIGQKSAAIWNLDRCTGKVNWSKVIGPGGTLGGFLYGSTLLKDVKVNGCIRSVFVGINGNSNNQVYQLNGQTWPGGEVGAVDAETGEILWRTGIPSGQLNLGALSSSKDVIFAQLHNTGQIQAYSVYDGHVIFTYQTNSTVFAGVTVGKDSVYIGNGYLRFLFGKPGQNLYALTL